MKQKAVKLEQLMEKKILDDYPRDSYKTDPFTKINQFIEEE